MLFLVAAGLGVIATFGLAWRGWFPGRSGRPWWRDVILTEAEDLRVGASALAAGALLVAAGGIAIDDVQTDRWEPVRPIAATVVARTADAAVVALAPQSGGGHSPHVAIIRRVTVPGLMASNRATVTVFLTHRGVAADDEPATWRGWRFATIFLLCVAGGSAAASFRRSARGRLISYE